MTDTNVQNGTAPLGVLQTIKKMIGFEPDYNVYDTDLVVHINTAFFNLQQLGVGPVQGFSISGPDELWDSFVVTTHPAFGAIKSYVYYKTRLAFDLPGTSFAIDAVQKQVAELEYRLNVEFDTGVPIVESVEL